MKLTRVWAMGCASFRALNVWCSYAGMILALGLPFYGMFDEPFWKRQGALVWGALMLGIGAGRQLAKNARCGRVEGS